MIKTPPGWGIQLFTAPFRSAEGWQARTTVAPPVVRRIGLEDLRWALARGWEDFGATRTDVVFLCVTYPILGLLLARLASGYEMLPLIFPLASGFALLGPLAAVGLNEMSRRREQGQSATLADAFGVFRSSAIGGIMVLGVVLMMLFVAWLTVAQTLYVLTLGPQPPVSLGAFAHDVFHTRAGWALVLLGGGLGFVFALVAFAISVVSFPMMLDRPVSAETAVRTSIRAVVRNPVTLAVWGMIIAGGLILAAIPALLGLVVVMPVLGHATWHLYRRMVPS